MAEEMIEVTVDLREGHFPANWLHWRLHMDARAAGQSLNAHCVGILEDLTARIEASKKPETRMGFRADTEKDATAGSAEGEGR